MGGLGSGAVRQRLHVEEVRELNLDPLLRGLRDGETLMGSRYIYGMQVHCEVSIPARELRLEWTQGGVVHRQVLSLRSRRTPSGGVYRVVECPTGRAVRRLYLPSGCDQWAGRRAYGLKHHSTAESPLDRAARRVRKAHQKLVDRGVSLDEGGWVARKPRYRRWDWIERKLSELDQAKRSWDARFVHEASVLLGLYD